MAVLSDADITACRHPRLGARFAVAVLCTIILLPVLAVLSVLGIFTLLLFWFILVLWVMAEVFYASLVDNTVLVSEFNYPRIHALSQEVREAMGVRREVSIFVYEAGTFNAWLVKVFRRRAIFLQSEVLETGVSDDEVRWVVGRFIGYLRVQQDDGFIGRMVRITERSGIFTLLVLPYSRAMAYTGDRLGLAAIGGDIGSAVSAMQKLLVGRELGYSINPLGIVDQRRRTKGSVFAFLARVGSPLPSTTARYVDLISFAQQRYPDAFAKFAAGVPGLPADLVTLSGERTSPASVGRAIGIVVALLLGLAFTFLAWPVVTTWVIGTVLGDPVSSTTADFEPYIDSAPDATTYPTYTDPYITDPSANTDAGSCAVNKVVTVSNQTGREIYELSGREVGQLSSYTTVLVESSLANGDSTTINLDYVACGCDVEVLVEFVGGDSHVSTYDMCSNFEVTLY